MLRGRTISAKQLKFLNGVSVLPSGVMGEDAVPQRRDLWMFLKCWLFPQVRHTLFTQRTTSLVTLLKVEPLSSYSTVLVLGGLLTDPPAPLGLPSRADTRARNIAWD